MEFTAFTPEEVAKKFGWSPRHVRKLAREIGACRVLGGRMVLLEEDVQALLQATKPEPTAKAHRIQSRFSIPQVTYADLVKRRQSKVRKDDK